MGASKGSKESEPPVTIFLSPQGNQISIPLPPSKFNALPMIEQHKLLARYQREQQPGSTTKPVVSSCSCSPTSSSTQKTGKKDKVEEKQMKKDNDTKKEKVEEKEMKKDNDKKKEKEGGITKKQEKVVEKIAIDIEKTGKEAL